MESAFYNFLYGTFSSFFSSFSLCFSYLSPLEYSHHKPFLFQEIEDWISGAGDTGFIFISMGSSVRTSNMPLSVHRLFVNALGRLPQRVLWKQDAEQNLTDIPSNVKLFKWLPQQDLLGKFLLSVTGPI